MSKKIFPKKQLLDVQEAADLLGVNPGTIRRWAQSRTLQGVKIGVRGDWRFTEKDILQMAKTNSLQESNSPLLAIPDTEKERVQSPDIDTVNLLSVPHLDWTEMKESEHFVQYYESDSYLLDSLSRFIGMGLRDGDMCVVVATKKHRKSLEDRLQSYGLDLVKASVKGQLTMLDARGTLDKFYSDGTHNHRLFYKAIGDIISKASKDKRKVRIFGEMVALLWEEGDQEAALHLEKLWNDLAKLHSFSVYCAYPMQGFSNASHRDSFNEIGHSHSKVIPTESFTALVNSDARFRTIAKLQQKANALESEILARKRLEKQKDEFLGMASHELKTPVTSLKAYAQILTSRFKKQGDESSVGMLMKMDHQINKLSNLISDLLDVTKVEVGKLQFKEEEFDINLLIQEVISEVQLTSSNHKIQSKLSLMRTVRGDRERIAQVMINLLSNAIKYSPEGEKIIVMTDKVNGSIRISVQDFGIGIRNEDRERIFDRFFRSEEGVETYAGLGLGLYISSEIVKRHGGRIWVEANYDKGSMFCFTLPLKK